MELSKRILIRSAIHGWRRKEYEWANRQLEIAAKYAFRDSGKPEGWS
jgi:hypothetical protein